VLLESTDSQQRTFVLLEIGRTALGVIKFLAGLDMISLSGRSESCLQTTVGTGCDIRSR
jgi:hypothetical protein